LNSHTSLSTFDCVPPIEATAGVDFGAGIKEMPPNGFLMAGVWADGIAKVGLADWPLADEAVRWTFANKPPTLPLAAGTEMEAPPNPAVPDDGATGLIDNSNDEEWLQVLHQ
jgi:hypothetical protein